MAWACNFHELSSSMLPRRQTNHHGDEILSQPWYVSNQFEQTQISSPWCILFSPTRPHFLLTPIGNADTFIGKSYFHIPYIIIWELFQSKSSFHKTFFHVELNVQWTLKNFHQYMFQPKKFLQIKLDLWKYTNFLSIQLGSIL